MTDHAMTKDGQAGSWRLTDEQLAKRQGMTLEEFKRWQEIKCRPAIRIEDLAGIPRDAVRRKYKTEHPSIDAMQGEVHEGEQDV